MVCVSDFRTKTVVPRCACGPRGFGIVCLTYVFRGDLELSCSCLASLPSPECYPYVRPIQFSYFLFSVLINLSYTIRKFHILRLLLLLRLLLFFETAALSNACRMLKVSPNDCLVATLFPTTCIVQPSCVRFTLELIIYITPACYTSRR